MDLTFFDAVTATRECSWSSFRRSVTLDLSDNLVYSVHSSKRLFRQWCEHHGIDRTSLCLDLHHVLTNGGLLLLSGPSYCGQRFVFDSFRYIFNSRFTLTHKGATICKCLDFEVLLVDCSSSSLSFDLRAFLLERPAIPCILLSDDVVSCDYPGEKVYYVRKPFAWYESYKLRLHPGVWLDELASICEGCLIEHPSQKYHMGVGGCLTVSLS